ncbi:hypothetical protein B0H34DRAFT_735016 [Crassisporium funariophilum]|nr:hypothetical protein B0H34DRAFT_735016 [Crassisporium funariophilum]
MTAAETTIDCFPNELLENIFEVGAYLPMQVDENYPRRPLFSKMHLAPLYPTSLMQVCNRWRELVLQMPILWSFIHLSRSVDSHRRLKTQVGRSLEWVPTYLLRSGNLPLHIILDTTRLPVEAAVGLLYPHSSRWCAFTLLVSHVGSLPAVLPLFIETRVPRLESLTIASDIYREGIIASKPLPPFFTSSTPELSSVHLNGVYVTWNAPPLSNLTNLELHFTSRWPHFSHLQEMFAASPMIQRLVIHDEIGSILRNVQRWYALPSIELAHLRYLEIEVYRLREAHADVASLMGLFDLPALETLVLRQLKMAEWREVAEKYHLPRDPCAFSGGSRVRTDKQRVLQTTLAKPLPFLNTLTVSGPRHLCPTTGLFVNLGL